MREIITHPFLLNVYLPTVKITGMPSTSPETRISEFVADMAYDDLPDGAVEMITRTFIDAVGVTLAGTVEGAGRQTAESTGVDPNTPDVATLLGVSGTNTPETVALRTALIVTPSIMMTFHGQRMATRM